MGKISQGILGPLSQSIGGVTGASVKGRPTLRRKSSGGVNPRTQAQQESRGAFSEASEYCRENRDAIIAQENFKEKKGVTIWNQMMSWYMAGGRLNPSGRRVEEETYGNFEVLRYYGWEPEIVDGKPSLVFPLDLIPVEGVNQASGYVEVIDIGETHKEPLYSIEGRMIDGDLVLSPGTEAGLFGLLPLLEQARVVMSLAIQDAQYQQLRTLNLLLEYEDCGVSLSGNGGLRSTAELQELCETAGDFAASAYNYTLTTSKNIACGASQSIFADGAAFWKGLTRIGGAKLFGGVTKSASTNPVGKSVFGCLNQVSAFFGFTSWDVPETFVLLQKVYPYMRIMIPAFCPGIGNEYQLYIVFNNSAVDADALGGFNVVNKDWCPVEWRGLTSVTFVSDVWFLEYGDVYVTSADVAFVLWNVAQKTSPIDWGASYSGGSGRLKYDGANWNDGAFAEEGTSPASMMVIKKSDEVPPMVEVGSVITNDRKNTFRLNNFATALTMKWRPEIAIRQASQ